MRISRRLYDAEVASAGSLRVVGFERSIRAFALMWYSHTTAVNEHSTHKSEGVYDEEARERRDGWDAVL